MSRVDAHQHFWSTARSDYGWLNAQDHPKIYRDFTPLDLRPLLSDARIDQTILVQAAPTVAETEYLLHIAAETLTVAGVVGWIDFDDKEAPEVLCELTRQPKLVGVRPMVQDLADDEWLLSNHLIPTIRALSSLGLCFDALVVPRHLSTLLKFLERHPELKVVIDHGAKPAIRDGAFHPWADQMRALARGTKAFCKLSGLVTEAGPNWSVTGLKPYVELLLEEFGPSRLMWGSDWPVLNETADYGSWIRAAETLIGDLPAVDQGAIFGGTANAFYGLPK